MKTMSEKYWTVKRYYDEGFWNKTRVRNAVKKGWITEEECQKIFSGEQEGDNSDGYAESAGDTN